MKTVNNNGHWTGYEPMKQCKDIVVHGASQSIKQFIAGQFSGTTPVTDGNNVNKYSDRKLDPYDLEVENTFNPEIEDRLFEKRKLARKQAEILLANQQKQEQAALAHKQEFDKYKQYFEEHQKQSS